MREEKRGWQQNFVERGHKGSISDDDGLQLRLKGTNPHIKGNWEKCLKERRGESENMNDQLFLSGLHLLTNESLSRFPGFFGLQIQENSSC